MDTRLPNWLTLLITLPFILMSIPIAFEWVSDTNTLLLTLIRYAAIIFAFLAGIHWGLAVPYLQQKKHRRIARLMLAESIIGALLAWLIMFMEPMYRLLAFAFLYAMIWGVDSLLFNNKLIPLWFFNLRGIITPIVVVSMYVAYFSII